MEYSFQEGNIVLTPPWIRHSYSTPIAPLPHYAIHFSVFPGYEKQFRNNAHFRDHGSELKIRLDHQYELPIIISDFPSGNKLLFEKVAELKQEADLKQSPVIKLKLRQVMLDLLSEIFDTVLKPLSPEQKILAKSIHHIDQYFYHQLTIPELAEIEGLTPNYFSTIFKKNYGISPIEYNTRKRLQLAKQLMYDKNMRIAEIAEACGYDDPYYFSKTFRKYENKSPNEYRKLLTI